MIKDQYSKQTKKLYNSTSEKQTTHFKNGQNIGIDSFSKKTYRWPTGTRKDAQHHRSGQCKSKTRPDDHSHLLEWLLSEAQEKKNAGKGVEKMEPLCTVDRNVNASSRHRKQCKGF